MRVSGPHKDGKNAVLLGLGFSVRVEDHGNKYLRQSIKCFHRCSNAKQYAACVRASVDISVSAFVEVYDRAAYG